MASFVQGPAAVSVAASSNIAPSIGRSDRPQVTLLPHEIAQLPLVPHYVYACLSEHVYGEPTRRPLPSGWREFLTCSEVGLEREGYFAAAYINEKLRHCIIAQRGTIDAMGLRAGVWMYFDEPTIQFSLAEQFSKVVRLQLALTQPLQTDVSSTPTLGVESPYFFSHTGHSLGAVLASCRAVAEHTYAITFESPGCRAFVEKTMHPFKADDADIISYMRSPNPINTLRPQCGYLVQLPFQESSIALPQAKFAIQLPKIHNYVRSKIFEYGVNMVPEVQSVLTKMEPIIKELLTHTQQLHCIEGIVRNFEECGGEPLSGDVVIKWPTHIMQFLEYYNIVRAMDEPQNQHPNAYAAFENLLQSLYNVSKLSRHKIATRFLNQNSQRLLALWGGDTGDGSGGSSSSEDWDPFVVHKNIPLSDLEKRALSTATVLSGILSSSVLTAFQMKQLLTLLVSRESLLVYIDNWSQSHHGTSKL